MSWIDIVSGSGLDRYGVKVDRPRYSCEPDVDYRVRLKSAPVTPSRDDGKAAFPVQGTEMHETWYGMSLRDYFAAKAMAVAFAHALNSGLNRNELVAQSAYEVADKMLAERAK